MSKPRLSQAKLKYLLHYDPDTGVFTWRPRPDDLSWTIRYAGTTCGTINTEGYKVTRINSVSFKCHRLAFLYMEGKMPPEQVDHINRDRGDNRWVNLRHASHTVNTRNAKIRKDSSTGCSGVYWYPRYKNWRVAIGSTHKPNSHVGYYDNLLDAIAARKRAEIKYGYPSIPT